MIVSVNAISIMLSSSALVCLFSSAGKYHCISVSFFSASLWLLSPFEILNPFRIIIDLLTDLVEIYIGSNLDRLIASVITVCHGTHIPVDSVRERVRETVTSS